jgi:hypothetical protein
MIDPNVSWQDYLSIKRMNPSTLVAGCKSMLRLKRAIDGGFPEESNAMRLGTGIHALLLEPEQFERRFVVMPDFANDPANVTGKGERSYTTTTSWAKAKIEEFALANKHRCCLTRVDYDTALTCIEALNSRPHFVDLVRSSNTEVTLHGKVEGIEFKGRVDLLHPTCIADLKTTYDVAQFGRTFASLEYAFKLSIYRELVRQNTVGLRDVKVIAQETKGDFDNAMFVVPSEVLDHAYSRVLLVIAKYKQALASNVWHGWDEGVDELDVEIPYWYKRKLEDIDWSNVELNPVEQQSYF